MDEVVEAIEKYHGLVPLVYDIETMSLDKARSEDMQYAVYLKREADREIRRQKYKRCLAMADKCVDLCHKAKDLYRWAEDENLEHHYNHKIEFFARWHKRWLAIAEKFKPNNRPVGQ